MKGKKKLWPWDYFRKRAPRVHRCRHCGYEVPADEIGKTAKLSGWPPLQHLHCSRCGRIIVAIPARAIKRIHA